MLRFSERKWLAWGRLNPWDDSAAAVAVRNHAQISHQDGFQFIHEDDSLAEDNEIPVDPKYYPVFLCYRRADANSATVIELRLNQEGGRRMGWNELVFRDQIGLTPGTPVPSTIRGFIEGCAVLIVLIGTTWYDKHPDHKDLPNRLFVRGDFVREELEWGLQSKTAPLTIPICLPGARFPNEADLPAELQKLRVPNGLELDVNDPYAGNWKRLYDRVFKVLGPRRVAPARHAIRQFFADSFFRR